MVIPSTAIIFWLLLLLSSAVQSLTSTQLSPLVSLTIKFNGGTFYCATDWRMTFPQRFCYSEDYRFTFRILNFTSRRDNATRSVTSFSHSFIPVRSTHVMWRDAKSMLHLYYLPNRNNWRRCGMFLGTIIRLRNCPSFQVYFSEMAIGGDILGNCDGMMIKLNVYRFSLDAKLVIKESTTLPIKLSNNCYVLYD